MGSLSVLLDSAMDFTSIGEAAELPAAYNLLYFHSHYIYSSKL